MTENPLKCSSLSPLSSLPHPHHQIPNQRRNNHFQKQPRVCCVNLQTILKEKDLSRKQSGTIMKHKQNTHNESRQTKNAQEITTTNNEKTRAKQKQTR
ncbi:unnamed protein product [Sphagnum jensenii]|uniref:Uncharacterized protein n=1 Tax=Sphagnum jensenii TaxID=128206 RepID=A0ABP0WRV3_9BRYO